MSFASQIQPIFTSNCTTGCHTGIHPAAGMSLASGAAFGSLVGAGSSTCAGRVRVTAGSVTASYLINKLTNTGICNGNAMPLSGGPLPAAQINLLRSWICQGAPNN